MTLQQLRYLVGIVDAGLNITAAADRLYTSQPGVSKQLKLLEAELGLQLFTRKGKSLSGVTSAGKEVIARARRILLETENIRRLADDLAGEQRGTLSIATTHTQARYVLPEIIRGFREQFPDVSLELHQGTSEQIAELIGEGRVDLAIATGSRELYPDLVMLPCYHWDRIVLTPQDHELARQSDALDLESLAAHPLITYVFSLTGESSFLQAFRARGLDPNVVFTARDADVIKTYVRMGLGVGVVASMAYACDDRDDLAWIDAVGLFPRCTTWIGFRRDQVLRDYTTQFIAALAPHLDADLIAEAAGLDDQSDVDALFADIELPLRSGCTDGYSSAA